ncbi:MAG: penicillin-binding protein 2 [Desulfotignum sp.]|nr:penicillin-binding protein 2 [Desulfotignum sp.]
MVELQKNKDRDWMKQRVMVASLCVLIVFMMLFLRLVYLQLIKGEEYRRLSETNCVRLKSIKPSRGLIFDRNGELLVDNRPAFDLVIVQEDAGSVQDTVSLLSSLIQEPYVELMDQIQKAGDAALYKPIVLKKDISRDQLAIVEAHKFDLPGIFVEIEPTRHYIHPELASHLLGYLGEVNKKELKSGDFPYIRAGDQIGRYGVEKSFESYLQGRRGGRQVEVDVNGRVVQVLKTVEPVPGYNLHLTLDLPLQQLAEELLKDQNGAVVALDPANGDVLVMVSHPGFNQNDFIGGISSINWKALMENPGRPMINKTIQAEYPPASTYKILTAIAGLEENLIDSHSTTFCPGFYMFRGRRYHCWRKHGHGQLNVVDALTQSCDVFFYLAGEKIGVDALAQYASGCGLGRATGIDLDHEREGLIPTSAWKRERFNEAWYPGETLSISIGQGFNLVTPLQMAVFTAAIANGGTLFRPRIVTTIKNVYGNGVEKIDPEIIGGIPAGKKTLDLVRQGMINVVEGDRGTARSIRIKQVELAGKTGTAQVFSRKTGEKFDNKKQVKTLQDHAWFVCYAPAQNPVIAISVIIEHGEHGSSAAAPVAGTLVKKYLGLLDSEKAVVVDSEG